MIYFTSDTHFNHANIIKFCARPFASVEEMNTVLIQNWNSRVTNDDEIYILGDFSYKGSSADVNRLLSRLNGKKYLIRGNHDTFIDNEDFDKTAFEWIKDYYLLNYQKTKIVLFHYPIFEWDGYFNSSIHLYGHVHNCGKHIEQVKRLTAMDKRAINVGVDVNDYFPVSIQTVLQRALS